MPWFLLYPLIGAALGAGTAKATGNDWKKGLMLGAGAGLGAGALPLALGGGAAGNAGWASLLGSDTAGAAAANAGLAKMGAGGAEGAKALAASAASGGAKTAGLSSIAKQAAIGTAMTGALGAAMPKYGQTQMLMQPGFLQPQSDPMASIQQLMLRKGRM